MDGKALSCLSTTACAERVDSHVRGCPPRIAPAETCESALTRAIMQGAPLHAGVCMRGYAASTPGRAPASVCGC
eukprot:5815846-Alexandrium_andersonii.AAC.1